MTVDDRFLAVSTMIAMAAAYAVTRDPLFGKMFEYSLVACFMTFSSPVKNWLQKKDPPPDTQ